MTDMTSLMPMIGEVPARGLTIGAGEVLTGSQKAAIILQVLRSTGGTLDLTQLPTPAQGRLAHDFSGISTVSAITVEQVITEFLAEMDSEDLRFGSDLASRLEGLDGVVDTRLLADLRSACGLLDSQESWPAIAMLDPEELAEIIEGESQRVGAVILSKLPADLSAKVLALLPDDLPRDLARAIPDIDGIAPAQIEAIGESLVETAGPKAISAFELDAIARIAAMLDAASNAQRDAVLEQLAEEDAALARKVRAKIFTFLDIATRVDGVDIANITRAVPADELLVALGYGRVNAAESVAHIFNNMSKRMAEQLQEEVQEAGDVDPERGEAAQAKVCAAIRDLADTGEITLIPMAEPEEE